MYFHVAQRISYIKIRDFIPVGVHLGHSVKNTLFHAAWMIITVRSGISIINLFKTALQFKLAFSVFYNTLSYLGPLWFVNLNSYMGHLTEIAAFKCGEFAAKSPWVMGSISNFTKVSSFFTHIHLKAYEALKNKHKKIKVFFKNWHLTRHSWPRAIFFPSVHYSYIAVLEALRADIPAFGIVDTDTLSHVITGPIQGNDEAITCLITYQDMVSNFILVRKFVLVALWLSNIRSYKRPLDFYEWIISRYKIIQGDKYMPLLDVTNFVFDNYNSMKKGLSLFLSQNHSFDTFFSYVDIGFSNSQLSFTSKAKLLYNLRGKLFYILRFYSFLKLAQKKKFVRKKFLNKFYIGRFFLRPLVFNYKFKYYRFGYRLYNRFFWNKLLVGNFKFYAFTRIVFSLLLFYYTKFWSKSFFTNYRVIRRTVLRKYVKTSFGKRSLKSRFISFLFKREYLFFPLKIKIFLRDRVNFHSPDLFQNNSFYDSFFITPSKNLLSFSIIDYKFDFSLSGKLSWKLMGSSLKEKFTYFQRSFFFVFGGPLRNRLLTGFFLDESISKFYLPKRYYKVLRSVYVRARNKLRRRISKKVEGTLLAKFIVFRLLLGQKEELAGTYRFARRYRYFIKYIYNTTTYDWKWR